MRKYAQEELNLFKKKLNQLKQSEETQIQIFDVQISEIRENGKDENGIDNSSYMMQLESLTDARNRCVKHLLQINNALLRIENGVYGVCIETGKLISKERLLAVPTTTLSIEGKNIREQKS